MTSTAWDRGVRWHLEQSGEQAPDMAADPLTVEEIINAHLRAADYTLEVDYLEHLRLVSYRQAEIVTRRCLIPQTWVMVLDRFPSVIVLPKAPVLSVLSVSYRDVDGNDQALSGSPPEWQLVNPSGPQAGKSRLYPAAGEAWPSTGCYEDAVTVTFRAGYVVVEEKATIPVDINHGRLLMIGELYKQRTESVPGAIQKAQHVADSLWKRYRVYES